MVSNNIMEIRGIVLRRILETRSYTDKYKLLYHSWIPLICDRESDSWYDYLAAYWDLYDRWTRKAAKLEISSAYGRMVKNDG